MTTEPPTAEWTIDDLARELRIPTRTIRFYQARGALMRPEIRGRVAYYGPAHAERLKLIAQLQDRGLRIEAIRDLVTRIDRGDLDLHEWLGMEQQVQAPWAADDRAQTVDEAGLLALAGSDRAGLIAELVRGRLVERRGDVYVIPSPALLRIALQLEASGIDLATVVEAGAVASKHLKKAVAALVAVFVKGTQEGTIVLDDPNALFSTLRPLGSEAVSVIFARQVERALRKLVADGLVSLTPKSKSKSKSKRAGKPT